MATWHATCGESRMSGPAVTGPTIQRIRCREVYLLGTPLCVDTATGASANRPTAKVLFVN